jgi:hypothetical protein
MPTSPAKIAALIQDLKTEVKDDLSSVKERLSAMDTKLSVHVTQQDAYTKCLNDHEEILRGEDKKSGLIGDMMQMKTELKITLAILSALGVTSLGGIGWLIINTISMMNELTRAGMR